MHLPRALPPLPAALAEHAGELTLVQRMPPPGLAHADASLLEVVDAARTGDSVAGSELVWRVRPKAEIEFTSTLGAVVSTHAGPGTVGFFWFQDDA